MTLKEKVQKSLEDCASAIDMPEKRYFDYLSRAAIDTVFDHLMEPSEKMIEAGFNRPYIEYGDRDYCADQNTRLTLQAILTQAKKEMDDEL